MSDAGDAHAVVVPPCEAASTIDSRRQWRSTTNSSSLSSSSALSAANDVSLVDGFVLSTPEDDALNTTTTDDDVEEQMDSSVSSTTPVDDDCGATEYAETGSLQREVKLVLRHALQCRSRQHRRRMKAPPLVCGGTIVSVVPVNDDLEPLPALDNNNDSAMSVMMGFDGEMTNRVSTTPQQISPTKRKGGPLGAFLYELDWHGDGDAAVVGGGPLGGGPLGRGSRSESRASCSSSESKGKGSTSTARSSLSRHANEYDQPLIPTSCGMNALSAL